MKPSQKRRFVIFLAAFTARIAYYYFETQIIGTPIIKLAIDGFEYERLALEVLKTHSLASPRFILRPPLYTFLVTAMFGLGGWRQFLMVAPNIVLGSLNAVLTYHLARRLLDDRRLAFIAGLVVALDLGSIIADSAPMTEALHNIFLTTSLLFLLRFVQRRSGADLIISGFSLALATLTRPLSLYLVPVVILGVILFRREYWRAALGYLVVFYALIGAWVYRNYYYTSIPELGTDAAYTILFTHGVSVLAHATGEPPGKVETQLEREIEVRLGNIDDPSDKANTHIRGYNINFFPDTPERVNMMYRMAREIFLEHPVWFLLTFPVGFVRMFGWSTNSRIPQVIQIWPNLVFISLLLIGLWHLLRRRKFAVLAAILIPSAIYTLLTLVATTSHVETRFRTPFTPLLAAACAVGIQVVGSWLGGQRAQGIAGGLLDGDGP
jgi:4-amino-4-deoxy-L-arabinose transferase-like glycosyltransferase